MKTSNNPMDFGNYVLYNTDNYKPLITNSLQEILNKFSEILIEYMRFISEKIKIKNKRHYAFIFERGIETLIHVFSMTFYYTKNLDLTFFHSQKAYYFYIEFIEQISDDNITFLQLSSRDAVVFVYKKTIYDINNDYKKTCVPLTGEETVIMDVLNSYMMIYKKISSYIINNPRFLFDKKEECINNACDKLVQITSLINKNKNKVKNPFGECIYLFIKLLIKEQVSIPLFFTTLEEFIKCIQIKKKGIDEPSIINKINIYYFTPNLLENKTTETLLQELFN